VEVQPFIVLSPADIVTLVNALFPERRPSSSHMDNDSQRRTGLASSASSMSGMSVPFRNAAASVTDASSILSASASSMTSDQTSREPLLDGNPASTDSENEMKPVPTEQYGKQLRSACSEMTRILGFEATSGSCHPCAERWAVLYISADGKQLKPRMRKDFDDEDEHDEDSPDSDSSDDEDGGNRFDLGNDYHQLKEAIAKLVEEYEIPKELAPDSESKNFSNRMTTRKSTLNTEPKSAHKHDCKSKKRLISTLTTIPKEPQQPASRRKAREQFCSCYNARDSHVPVPSTI
jgi:hypothetical protein